MKYSLTKVSIALAVVIATSQAQAQSPVGDATWYYEIGGAAPISISLNNTYVPIDLFGSVNLPRSCSTYDLQATVENLLGNIGRSVDEVEGAFVAAVTGAIAAIPGIIIQRATPGLYEHFQRGLARARGLYNQSLVSCQQILETVGVGEETNSDLSRIAQKQNLGDMSVAGAGDGRDISEDVKVAAIEAGDFGIDWMRGKYGGINQPAIEPIRHYTQAGYNILVNQSINEVGGPGGDERIVQLWDTPIEAASWTVDVLGDSILRTSQNAVSDSQPGVGLIKKYQEDNTFIREELQMLLDGSRPSTIENLSEISSPGLIFSDQILTALRNHENFQERGLWAGKLASDLATSRTIERALAVKRMLLTGVKAPDMTYEPTKVIAMNGVTEIQQEIENFLYEAEVRKATTSNTAMALLSEDQFRRLRSLGTSGSTSVPRQSIERGGEVRLP